jgi:hypothetical protein
MGRPHQPVQLLGYGTPELRLTGAVKLARKTGPVSIGDGCTTVTTSGSDMVSGSRLHPRLSFQYLPRSGAPPTGTRPVRRPVTGVER